MPEDEDGFNFREWVENHPDARSEWTPKEWEQEEQLMTQALMSADARTVLPLVLTVEDVARYLRIAEDTVRAYLRQGRMPGVQIAGRWRVERDAFQGWLVSQQEQTRLRNAPQPPEVKKPSVARAVKKRRGDGSGPRR